MSAVWAIVFFLGFAAVIAYCFWSVGGGRFK